jgi:hypothetical protein
MKTRWPILLALLTLFAVAASVSARPEDPERLIAPPHAGPAGAAVSGPVAAPLADVRAQLPPVSQAALRRASAGHSRSTPRRVSRNPAGGFTTQIDDFEGAVLDTALWPFVGDLDADPATNGEYFWGLSANRASHGRQSLWAIGGGADGVKQKAGDNYPCGVRSAAWLLLDLTPWKSPKQLDLNLDFWLNTRTFDDSGVVPDGLFISYFLPTENDEKVRVVLKALTAQFPRRFWDEPVTIDLLAAKELYPPYRELNLSGKSVLMELLFKTKDPECTGLPEGLYVDNLRVVSDVEPVGGAPTSTPGPTSVPLPTEPVPTVTPGPTEPGPTHTPAPTEPATAMPTAAMPTSTVPAPPTPAGSHAVFVPYLVR